MKFLVGEGSDNFVSLFRTHSYYSEVVLDGVLSNILHYLIYAYIIGEGDKHAAHESSRLLIDIDSNIFGRSVLVEGFSNILIGKITIDVLHVEA